MTKSILIFLAIAGALALSVLILVKIAPDPPVSAVEAARIKLSGAGARKADTYSRKLYSEARILYDSAMSSWQRENKKFIYSRNYEKVRRYAEQSAGKSSQAADNSLNSVANLERNIRLKLDTLDIVVKQINKFFNDYPLTEETRIRISQGKLLLEEARVSYNQDDYSQANRKIVSAEYLLLSSYENATTNLRNYFTLYPTWKKWVKTAIRESERNGNYSIIIDKFSKKCFVYLGGSKKYEFAAELGTNWVGSKRVKGDNATPEGRYRIVRKFEGSKTKYHKALLLDYPNEDDKKRFRDAIADGSLPPNSKIGGLIEIHGNGGKGVHWTEGCIALTDKEIDLVYRSVGVGTPVTIVGSLVDLDTVLER